MFKNYHRIAEREMVTQKHLKILGFSGVFSTNRLQESL